jgi:glutamine phosphoribosylpyrophosphate amidotransferase
MCNKLFIPKTGAKKYYCASCSPSVRLKRVYNITFEEVKYLALKQGNMCAICGKQFSTKVKPFIDHSHTTGKIRGLLCFNCNTGLGMFNDSIDSLTKAIQYVS